MTGSARAHGVPLVALVAALIDLGPSDRVGLLTTDDGAPAAPSTPAASPLPADPAPAASR